MPRSTIRAVPEIDFVSRRSDMVEHQIAARGVRSKLVLEAMRKVPREEFLPPSLREFAYEDSPLPIAEGQTISQPYIVSLMADALLLKGGEQVLEIGTGSGYAAAVLAEIAANVYSVERIGQLAEKAAVTLTKLGCDNVHVLHADDPRLARARALRCNCSRSWRSQSPRIAPAAAQGGRAAGNSGRHGSPRSRTGARYARFANRISA
jgi:Protein-L-isoaspartate(D-aspartate) O-methyltransferase (PCMT)